MIRVGVTGGIGTGKSLITRIFQIFNVPVFSSDQAAKLIIRNDPEVKLSISDWFGPNMFPEGNLNRKALAEILFQDTEALDRVNRLVHPKVLHEFDKWCDLRESYPYVIHEAAILFETGYYRLLDFNILVVAPEETRIQRIMNRDNCSREHVLSRISAQWNDQDKGPLADYIISNDDSSPVLPAVIEVHNKLLYLSNGEIR